MKTALFLAASLVAATAAAQSPAPAPAPERPSTTGSLNLNLKLDEKTRRNILVEPPAEKAKEGPATAGAALPALGGSARSFDPPSGSRPKSTGGVFPKSDAP